MELDRIPPQKQVSRCLSLYAWTVTYITGAFSLFPKQQANFIQWTAVHLIISIFTVRWFEFFTNAVLDAVITDALRNRTFAKLMEYDVFRLFYPVVVFWYKMTDTVISILTGHIFH